MKVVDVTLVLDTNQYASGDVLAVPQEVTYVFPEKAGRLKLQSVLLLDEDDQAQAVDLVFFNDSATLGTINNAVSISDVDARKITGIVEIATSDYVDFVNSQVAYKTGIDLVLKGGNSSDSLFIGAICRSGTPTYTASGIKLKLGFE